MPRDRGDRRWPRAGTPSTTTTTLTLPRSGPHGLPSFPFGARTAAIVAFNTNNSQRVSSASFGSCSGCAPQFRSLLRMTLFLSHFTDKTSELREVKRPDPAFQRG